jgi:hypothetical protein
MIVGRTLKAKSAPVLAHVSAAVTAPNGPSAGPTGTFGRTRLPKRKLAPSFV